MGLFSNPANWAITDTLQGQQGGYTYNQMSPTRFLSNNTEPSAFSGGGSAQGGGGGGGTGYTGGTVDPNNPYGVDLNQSYGGEGVLLNGGGTNSYAQQQAAAQAKAQQAARDAFNTSRNILNSSLSNMMSGSAQGYQRGIIDKANEFNASQRGLDSKAINADMAKRQGYSGILNMVGQGIKSGGVMLANKNAGNSSGAQAIANAYGQLGQRQASGVNNQYGQAMNQIGLDQSILDASKAEQTRRWGEDKTTIVNNIVADAEQRIAAINEVASGAGITERMDMEAEKARIRNEALGQLQQYDGEMSKIQAAQSNEQRMSESQRLSAMGQSPDQQFNYSTEAPAQWQGTGPFASELPIFTYGRNRRIA